MSTLSQRGLGAPRLAEQTPRDAQTAILRLADGMEVRGTLHRTPGTRTLDLLNREAGPFLAVTNALVTLDGHMEHVEFMAVNKAHVVSLREAPAPAA